MPLIAGVWRPVLSLPIVPTTTDLNVFGRATLVFGYSVVETTGSASAAFDLLDGNAAGSTLVSPVTLDPGQSRLDWLGAEGVFYQSGPFLHMVSGSIRGAIYYVDVTSADLLNAGVNNV